MPITTYTWLGGATDDWGIATDWSGGVVPDGTVNATIAGTETETVTVSVNQAANVLMLNDANATLAVTNNATLSVYGGLDVLAAHEIDILNGTLYFSGGSQTIDGTILNLGHTPEYSYGSLSSGYGVSTLGPGLTVNGAFGQISSGVDVGDGIVNEAAINFGTNLVLGGHSITNEAAIAMLNDVPGSHRITLGADKAYDTADFVAELRAMKVTPHVARNITARRGSNIDGRTTRHAGYEISQTIRKRIEEANNWIKTVGGMARTVHRGLDRVAETFRMKASAYNLVRLPKLLAMA